MHRLRPERAVRWPNDVMAGGRKLAGVLCELRDGQLVVGVGINANLAETQLPAGARVPATSLQLLARRSGRPCTRCSPTCCGSWRRAMTATSSTGSRGSSATSCAAVPCSWPAAATGPADGVDDLGRLIVGGVAYSSAEVERVDV